MAWLTQWWTFAVTVLVVFAPGFVAARSLGLRRLAAWAFAPVASIAMIVLLAIVYPFVRIAWTPLSATIGLAVLAAAFVVGGRLLRIPARDIELRGSRWPVVAGLVGGALLVAARFIVYIGDPANVSQSNDAPFHLGAVRAILDGANASPLGLGGLVDPEARGSFYPGAWHAVASLTSGLSGAGIPEAANVLSVVVAALVWPLGIAWLAQAATGRRLAGAAAAALSPALLAFPLLLIQYGILYAYLIAVAILPAAAAVVVVLARGARLDGRDARPFERPTALGLAIGMALLAVAVAQPSLLLAWGVLVGFFGVSCAVRAWRSETATTARRRTIAVTIVAGAVVLAAAWLGLSTLVDAGFWGPVRSLPRAAVDIASSGYAGTHRAWWVSALVAVGIAGAVWIPRVRWVAASWFVFAGLYVVAAAVGTPWIRLPLVGPWYGDTYRFAALLPVVSIPLAAVGAVVLADAVASALRRRSPHSPADRREAAIAWIAIASVLAVGAAVFAREPLVQRYHVATGQVEERSRFVIADDTWLSIDERALLERLSSNVPTGARVIGNPGTGAAFGYALSGVDVYPAKWQLPRDPAFAVLGDGLVDAATDPSVCAAVDDLGAEYVLDFGPGERGTGREVLPGLTGFDGREGFELVDREGSASLWRITGC